MRGSFAGVIVFFKAIGSSSPLRTAPLMALQKRKCMKKEWIHLLLVAIAGNSLTVGCASHHETVAVNGPAPPITYQQQTTTTTTQTSPQTVPSATGRHVVVVYQEPAVTTAPSPPPPRAEALRSPRDRDAQTMWLDGYWNYYINR